MGLESPLGKWFKLSDSRMCKIIGVAKDAHFQSLHREIDNRIFYIKDISESTGSGIILIRIKQGNITEGIAAIRSVWESINPISPFEFRFVDSAQSGALHRPQPGFHLYPRRRPDRLPPLPDD